MLAKSSPATVRNAVVASGYAIKINVRDGQLHIHDGLGRDRRELRIHRTAGLKRLVILGRDGYISLDAIGWLADTGAAFLHLDRDAKLLATSTASAPAVPTLRRAQALAAANTTGLEAARHLLAHKVQGQTILLPELPGGADAQAAMNRELRNIEQATDIDTILAAEASAASIYWRAWQHVPVRLAPRRGQTRSSIPEHWHRVGPRASAITRSPRRATTPAHAILNLMYTLATAETTLAIHAAGLDPTLGIWHADRDHDPARNALAFDLVEAIRPTADAYLLQLLRTTTLSTSNLGELSDGTVRLSLPFATELAERALGAWRAQIEPHVAALVTLLSGRKSPRHRQARAALTLPHTCRVCGQPISRRERTCATCRAQAFQEQADRARTHGQERLASLRNQSQDPAHGGRAAQLRGSKNRDHQHAVRAYQGPPIDPQEFAATILPGLRDRPIAEIAATTGLSHVYCSLIRLGKRTPHPRHWPALRGLGRNGGV